MEKLKILKKYNKETIDMLKGMGFKTQYNMLQKIYHQDISLVLDFADNSVDVAKVTPNVSVKEFYMTIKRFDDLYNEIKCDLEILKLNGVIDNATDND